MPTYRQLSQRAGYSGTALSSAAGGRKLPSLEVTLAFVGACGGAMDAWEERWHALAAELGAEPSQQASSRQNEQAAAESPGEATALPPAGREIRRQPWWRGRTGRLAIWRGLTPWRGIMTAAVVIAAALGVLALFTQTRPPHHRTPTAASSASGATSFPTLTPTAPASMPSATASPATRHRRQPQAPPQRTPVLAEAGPSTDRNPSPSPSPATAARSSSAPATFAALAGPDCAPGNSSGSYPGAGWIGHSTGGYCGGFQSHWITGVAAYSTYTWWFRTGLSNATCSFDVFIPEGSTTVVGGHPAHYSVYTGSGQAAGAFDLDQPDNMGSWLMAGSFAASGEIRVVLDNVAAGSHQVAASALKVQCTT